MLKVGIEQSAYLPYGEFENQIKKLKEHAQNISDKEAKKPEQSKKPKSKEMEI